MAPNINSDDFYERLGVPRNAPERVINRAFRQLTKIHHPDRNPDNQEQASERYKKINEAHDVLTNPEERKMYDQFGKNYKQGGGMGGGMPPGFDPADLQNIFGQMFGGGMNGGGSFNFSSGGMPGGGFSFSSAGGGGPGMNGFSFSSGGPGMGGGEGFNPFASFGGMGGGMGDMFGGSHTQQGFAGSNGFSQGFCQSPRQVQSPLPQGTRVYLYGLSNGNFNGLEGSIQSFNGERFVVNIDGMGPKKLRPQNLSQSIEMVVHSLSHAQLNGLTVESVGYTANCERVRCKFQNGQIKNIKPVNLEIPRGTVVHIEDLQNPNVANILNGKFARIICFSHETGRYEVQMSNANRTYKVRPENIRI